MKCLVVIAHPITDSLCHTMAQSAIAALIAEGHEVMIEDLYLLYARGEPILRMTGVDGQHASAGFALP